MKKVIQIIKFLGLLISVLFLTTANAQVTYTSIADGNWADFGIWSTDGESPCYCAPPSLLTGAKVHIQHNVNSKSEITLGRESTLIIDITASLNMPGANMNVEEGCLIAYGRLTAAELDVCDDGIAMIGSPGLVSSSFEIHGTLDIMFQANDTFNVGMADVNINFGATLALQNAVLHLREGDLVNQARIDLNNASISVPIGDIRNDGTMAFSMGCVSTYEGDFYNTGVLTGEGAINVAGALVSDVGEMSGMYWCASEWYTLEDEPSCVEAAILCGNIGSARLEAFKRVELSVRTCPEGIEISWTVDGENDVHLYEIQKATSNYMFFPIAWVDPSPEQLYHKQYSCLDNNPAYEVIYYRLAIWDSDGQTSFSNVVQVGKSIATPPSI